VPLTFENPQDYDNINLGDELMIENTPMQIMDSIGEKIIKVRNLTSNTSFSVNATLTKRQAEMLIAGGLLAEIKALADMV
jgi:aconitate hydratase